MKLKIAAIAFFTSTTISGYSIAKTCYEVSGYVATENVTSTLQIGNMTLTLSDGSGSPVFSDSGSLVGNITGSDGFGRTLLSHKARFPQGDSFVTSDDTAELVSPFVRNFLDDGSPCSFFIHETITDIPKGTRLFKNVSDVEVFADGYISNCPGENENHFELSGNLCVE